MVDWVLLRIYWPFWFYFTSFLCISWDCFSFKWHFNSVPFTCKKFQYFRYHSPLPFTLQMLFPQCFPFLTLYLSFLWCVCMWCMCWRTHVRVCGSLRTTSWSRPSPATFVEVAGIELRFPGLRNRSLYPPNHLAGPCFPLLVCIFLIAHEV